MVTQFAQRHPYALSAIAISLILYFYNFDGVLGGPRLTDPRSEAVVEIVWSFLPFVWLASLLMLGQPGLRFISAIGFIVFGINVFVTVLTESSTIASNHDDNRTILAIKQIDGRSDLVTYRVNDRGTSAVYRQEWSEKKILPGIIWCQKLASDKMDW